MTDHVINPQKLCIYMEVANAHRLSIIEPLSKTLWLAGFEVFILCEEQIKLNFEGQVKTYFYDNTSNVCSLKKELEATDVVIEQFNLLDEGSEESVTELNNRRTTYLCQFLEHNQIETLFIWGGNFSFQQDFISSLQTLDKISIKFMEVAWFNQKHFVYIDNDGVNALSSITKKRPQQLTLAGEQTIDDWIRNYKSHIFYPSEITNRNKTVFVPLQVDSDTSIQKFSQFKAMQDFVQYLEHWIDEEYTVVFKGHPKATYHYPLMSSRNNFKFVFEGSVQQFIASSSLVVGINSTVLLEARLLGKPVVSFGKGIFTNHNVFCENHSFSHSFNEAMKIAQEVCPQYVKQYFFDLIFKRQISIDSLKKNDVIHLLSRMPFDELEVSSETRLLKKMRSILEGKIMIKIGHSKVAKSASIDVDNEGQVIIGNGTEVRHNAVIEVSGKYNGTVKIGNDCVIGVSNWVQGSGKVDIEDDVIIGPFVAIISTNHQYEDMSKPISKQPLTTGTVTIKKGAWIGAHCTILQNVVVGENSIVAANSVVNSDVPDNAIVAGSPAKIIKMRS